MTEEILALCRAMGAPGDREELLLPLVRAACAALAGRLREGLAPEDCGEAFPLAAAMLAADQLAELTGGGGELASFTAGDLTIRQVTGRTGGKTLSDRAEALMEPWLRDAGFAFQGVEG